MHFYMWKYIYILTPKPELKVEWVLENVTLCCCSLSALKAKCKCCVCTSTATQEKGKSAQIKLHFSSFPIVPHKLVTAASRVEKNKAFYSRELKFSTETTLMLMYPELKFEQCTPSQRHICDGVIQSKEGAHMQMQLHLWKLLPCEGTRWDQGERKTQSHKTCRNTLTSSAFNRSVNTPHIYFSLSLKCPRCLQRVTENKTHSKVQKNNLLGLNFWVSWKIPHFSVPTSDSSSFSPHSHVYTHLTGWCLNWRWKTVTDFHSADVTLTKKSQRTRRTVFPPAWPRT